MTGIPIRIQRDDSDRKPERMFEENSDDMGTAFWEQYNKERATFNIDYSRWFMYKRIRWSSMYAAWYMRGCGKTIFLR